MIDTEYFALKRLWSRLAPDEPNASDFKREEVKWEMENVYHIANFWRDDTDTDGCAHEVARRQEANERWDNEHAR
jgi:hypothetical protein